jgi:hypothetical protein
MGLKRVSGETFFGIQHSRKAMRDPGGSSGVVIVLSRIEVCEKEW